MKDRERALQSLDLAYFKYCGIIRNLEEGFKVGVCALLIRDWADLFLFLSSTMTLLISSVNSKKSAKHGVFSDGKNYCKLFFASPGLLFVDTWSSVLEVHQHQSSQKLSLDNDTRRQPDTPLPSHHAREQRVNSRFANLLSQGPPSLSTNEWGFEDVVLPPGPKRWSIKNDPCIWVSRWWLQSIIRYPVASTEFWRNENQEDTMAHIHHRGPLSSKHLLISSL